jgi:hypothetical protein
MAATADAAAWQRFLDEFFAPPNELTLASHESVPRLAQQAQTAWTRSGSPVPFFLPLRVQNWSYWYAVCQHREQSVWLADLIRCHVGSWVDDFDGRPIEPDSTAAVDVAVNRLLGADGAVFRLRVPKADPVAQKAVFAGLDRLAKILLARPYRGLQMTRPMGRVLGDFWDACANDAVATAEETLAVLTADHRLSRNNALFLQLQFLATFEKWEELEALDSLQDLIRLDRPALASDALCRLVMARLPEGAGPDQFATSAEPYGTLVESVAKIRSPAGAQFYALRSLSLGEPGTDVAVRLLDAGWYDHACARQGLADLLPTSTRAGAPAAVPSGPVDTAVLEAMVAEGRLDTAMEMLQRATPTLELAPLMVLLAQRTLGSAGFALVQTWRAALGEAAVAAAMVEPTIVAPVAQAVARPPTRMLAEAFDAGVSATARAEQLGQLAEAAPGLLMRRGALADFVETVRPIGASITTAQLPDLLETLLDIERNLYSAAGTLPGLQDLRGLVLELWAVGDDTGGRDRAARCVDLLGRTLEAGLPAADFDEVADNLLAAWAPFLTDADLPLGLEALEILSAYSPTGSTATNPFAAMLLSRIGQHNAHRIDRTALEVCAVLAQEYGLEPAWPSADPRAPRDKVDAGTEFAEDESDWPTIPDGTYLAIYSLMEPAVRRAVEMLRRRYPKLRTVTLAGKVASDALRDAARDADVMVIADRAATHAATDAIRDARGHGSLHFAMGKGTNSLLTACLEGLKQVVRTAH